MVAEWWQHTFQEQEETESLRQKASPGFGKNWLWWGGLESSFLIMAPRKPP